MGKDFLLLEDTGFTTIGELRTAMLDQSDCRTKYFLSAIVYIFKQQQSVVLFFDYLSTFMIILAKLYKHDAEINHTRTTKLFGTFNSISCGHWLSIIETIKHCMRIDVDGKASQATR